LICHSVQFKHPGVRQILRKMVLYWDNRMLCV
jgi:hypothetical protein